MPLFSDPNNFINTNFPDDPFKIKHSLPENKLFDIESLVELARKLPAEQIEWNAGDANISQDPSKTPANGLSPEDTVRTIEQCKSWLVLKNIQTDAEYNLVFREYLDEIEAIAGSQVAGISDRAGFIFISSPNSITPFHMDPEHNFLLQLRGSKTLQVFDQRDRSVVTERNIESTYYGEKSHRNMEYKDSYASKGNSITLNSGEALHIPIHAPHWVQNGNAVSVSFSITFRSSRSRKAVRLYSLNARLREKGMAPSNVGTRPMLDNTKDLMIRTAIGAKRILRGQSSAQ